MKPTAQQLQPLITLTGKISPLSEPEMEAFLAPFEMFTAARKVILTPAGEPERYLYFVLDGVQRIYQTMQDGREATLVFTYPPSFAGVLDAMISGKTSKYDFETLTASRFLRAPVSDILAMASKYSSIKDLITMGLAQSITGLLERLAEMQCLSSEEKFRNLLSRSPHILTWVPHKYLANYIGIDATNFSKFINSVKA